MFCPSCGSEIQKDAAFCQSCGAKIAGNSAARQGDLPKPPPVPKAPLPPVNQTSRPVYFRKPEKSDRGAGLLIGIVIAAFAFIAFIGIIAAIAIPNLLTAIQRGKQKRTMADIQAIGTAIEAYYVDNRQYPNAASMTELTGVLQPKYIRQVPKADGWEHEFKYTNWSEGYAIGSAGKDGVWERTDLRDYTPVSSRTFDADIVFARGEFVQHPDTSSYATAMGPSSRESATPAPPLRFEQLNFTFQAPPKPWVQMDAKKINKASTLAFMRSHPEVLFFLIAEKIPNGMLDTPGLAEISKGNLKSAATNVDLLEEGNYNVRDRSGIRFVTKANIGGNDMLYVHWVYSEGDYAYQLITAGEIANEQTIRDEAAKMLQNFAPISVKAQ